MPVAPATADVRRPPLRRSTIALVGVVGIAVLIIAWAWVGPARSLQRPQVSLLLYGQPDPDHLTSAGLHGLGGRIVSVAIDRRAPCVFRVATPETFEDIDFGEVVDIHQAKFADPVSGVVAALAAGLPGTRRTPALLAVTVLSGSERAVCGPDQCRDRRVFALAGPDRIAAARSAAEVVRSRCMPPRLTAP